MTQLPRGTKLAFKIVAGRHDVNRLMDDFGLKPEYKVFAKPFEVEVTLDGTKTLEQVFYGMQDRFAEHMLLSSVEYLGRRQEDGTIRPADDDPSLVYINEQFREVSDGENVRFLLQEKEKDGRRRKGATTR